MIAVVAVEFVSWYYGERVTVVVFERAAVGVGNVVGDAAKKN